MRVFKCNLMGLSDSMGSPIGSRSLGEIVDIRAAVFMLEDHDKFGGEAGRITITSAVKFIDFERGYALTQNNIYDFSGE